MPSGTVDGWALAAFESAVTTGALLTYRPPGPGCAGETLPDRWIRPRPKLLPCPGRNSGCQTCGTHTTAQSVGSKFSTGTRHWGAGTMSISTRRFLARPSGVSFDATGCDSPRPTLEIRPAGTPWPAR